MEKVAVISLLVLVGFFGMTIPSGAHATAMMNVIYDEFVLDANTIWGETPEELMFGYHEPRAGTVNASTLSGSLLSGVSETYSAFSSTNVAGAVSRISSSISDDDFFVNLHSNLEIGPAVGMAEYGISKSAWNLVFGIVGEGATFSNIYSSATGIWWDYNLTQLFDMTSGLIYSGDVVSINLLGGHTYALHAESVQTGSGRTGGSDLGLQFGNVHLNVAEPSTIVPFIVGLIGIGISLKHKRLGNYCA